MGTSRHTPLRVAFRRPWPATRRGAKLWMLSLIIGLLGFNYIVSPIPDTTRESLALPAEAFPLPVWGGIIIGLCAVAMFTAYCHHGRDRYGYTLLAVFAWGWAAAYLTGPLLFDASTRAFSGALSWLVIGAFVFFSAGDQ